MARARGTRGQSVGELGERGLLARIERLFRSRAGVLVDIGDDAAVLATKARGAVLSADMLVEGVDFDWRFARPRDVGHKAAAVNLSDVAAMGAVPRGLLLSLALRPSDAVVDVLALIRAVNEVGARYGAPLVGGDLSSTSGPMVVAVTAYAELSSRRVLRRRAARIGDRVLVSGVLGEAALALASWERGQVVRRGVAARQLRPTPQVELGRRLAEAGIVRACADISDGLASDVLHLVPRGLGVSLEAAKIPIARAVREAAPALGLDARALALCGGEDFELLLAVRSKDVARARALGAALGVPLTEIGAVRRGEGLELDGEAWVGKRGFAHFGDGYI